jgi:murein L,D-transpeptidase YafK
MLTRTHPTRRTSGFAPYRLALLLFLAGVIAPSMANERARVDAVLVYKSERLLMLLNGGEIVGHYRISLGRNPVGPKLHEGDYRTPEGRYVLDWRNPDSRFYRSIHISYPNPSDWQRAQRSGVDPGGNVMIHGLPSDPVKAQLAWDDWTDGCIAVPNEAMDAIWNAVQDGTLIVIRP